MIYLDNAGTTKPNVDAFVKAEVYVMEKFHNQKQGK